MYEILRIMAFKNHWSVRLKCFLNLFEIEKSTFLNRTSMIGDEWNWRSVKYLDINYLKDQQIFISSFLEDLNIK